MTFVGPRPERAEFVCQFVQYMPAFCNGQWHVKIIPPIPSTRSIPRLVRGRVVSGCTGKSRLTSRCCWPIQKLLELGCFHYFHIGIKLSAVIKSPRYSTALDKSGLNASSPIYRTLLCSSLIHRRAGSYRFVHFNHHQTVSQPSPIR